MRRFIYKARDRKTGKTISGSVQAESEQSAGRILLEQGYLPKSIRSEDDGLLAKAQGKVTAKDRIAFTRQFATLVGAGLPLSNSLHMIADQTESKPLKKLIEEITAQVESGKTLHDAFAKHPDVFNKVYLSLIAAGEASGSLDTSLRRLADQQEKDAGMISKIRGALVYPGIVIVVIAAVVVFLMTTVVPEVEGLYQDLGKELPDLTAFMVALSDFLVHQWWVILLVVVGIVLMLVQFKKTETGSRIWAKMKLNVPIFKALFLRLYSARFARTMQLLLSAGVSMLDSLKLSAEAANNIVIEDVVNQASTMVRSGKPLSVALKGKEYILPMVPQMAATGEQSGKIDEMLGRAATVYENELDEKIAGISTMIEPVLMVVLAVVVGGIVLAILFPIYTLVGNIGV